MKNFLSYALRQFGIIVPEEKQEQFLKAAIERIINGSGLDYAVFSALEQVNLTVLRPAG